MRLTRLAGVGGFILGSFAAPAAKPTVMLLDASPVVVAGSGYTAGAHVLVSYRSGSRHVRRRVTATIAGRFRVVLKGVVFERCKGLELTAAGASLRAPSCAVGRPSVTAQSSGLVTGARFVPRERVSVSAHIGDLVLRATTTATASGAFTARLPTTRTACTNTDVRAVGALGSTASFTIVAAGCRKPKP